MLIGCSIIIIMKNDFLLKTIRTTFSLQGILFICILMACFFSYLQITDYQFLQWDDDAQITKNVYVKNLDFQSISHNFIYERFTFLTLTLYSVIYKVWGNNPSPFHWFSIILHLLNVFLVYQLIKKFSKNIFTIIFVTLLFALHPMRVESVAWISEIKDLLFTFFSLLSFLFYFKYLKKDFNFIFFLLATLMALFASLSKIQGLLVPFSFFLIDIFCMRKTSMKMILEKVLLILMFYILFFDNLNLVFLILNLKFLISVLVIMVSFFLFRKRRFFISLVNYRFYRKIGIFTVIGIAGIIILFIYFTKVKIGLWNEQPDNVLIFSFPERFLLAGFALWFYLKNLFFPASLNAVHPYPIRQQNGAFPSEYYFTLIVLLLVIAFSIILVIKRKKIPEALIFGWFFFLVNISMVLHFISIEGRLVVADRYSYLAYLGLFISLSSLVEKYIFNKKEQKRTLIVCFGILLFLLSYLTYNRCKVWENTGVLFTDVLNKDPGISFAYCSLAASCMTDKMPDKAISYFDKAIEIDSKDASAFYNRAFAHLEKKNDKKALDDFLSFIGLTEKKSNKALGYVRIGEIYLNKREDSIAYYYFNLALKNDTSQSLAYNNRGIYYLNKNKIEEARNDFKKAIKFNSYYSEAYNNLGSVCMAEGDYNMAQRYFDRAIELDPGYKLAYDNRGYLKYMNGDAPGAVKDYNREIEIDPTFYQAYIKRGRAYAQMKKYSNAISDFSFVLTKEPENMIALVNRAYAYFYDNKINESEKDFNAVTTAYPDNALAWQNLAWFHMQNKNYKSAAIEYEKSIGLDKTLVVSYVNLGWIYIEIKEFDEAAKVLENSLVVNPKNADALFLLGELNRKRGNSQKSCDYYKSASQLGSAQAKNALKLYCKNND